MTKSFVVLLSLRLALSNGFVPLLLLLSSRSRSTVSTSRHQHFPFSTKTATPCFNPSSFSSSPSSALNVAATETLQDAWTAYNNALEVQPLLVKSVSAGIILGAADLSGQAIEDIKGGRSVGQDIDLARTVRFAFFGLVLQAVRRETSAFQK
jgi:hypothetical protein